MKQAVPIINRTLDLADCKDEWFFDETYQVWCLEDILYTLSATTPKFQRMSIFVPKPYMSAPGVIDADGAMGKFTAKTAPVVFENNSAGYMQMPHTWLGGPRDEAGKYLERGMIYVTCGCRGRESRDQDGKLCGKSPWALVDLKTGIRFLRHNAKALPGNMDHMISVGWSAGGAMSSLVGITGDAPRYLPFLEQNGAFMDESDAVYAAQVYCPIVDLDHADIAYEWQFQNDSDNEASPAGPAGTMTPFQAALSKKLAAAYVEYFNGLELKDPSTGAPLKLNEDGRSGSGYDYLIARLEDSATDYLGRLSRGELPETYTPEDYLAGSYTHQVPAPKPGNGPEKDDVGLHHAGAAVMMPPQDIPEEEVPSGPPSLGDLVSRPPKGVPYKGLEFPTVDASGTDKRSWLSWDGQRAHISSLDDYILNHRRRMKPCTSFDTLGMDSGENQEFGTPEQNYLHFSEYIAPAIMELKDQFPNGYTHYYEDYAKVAGDKALAERRYLINPMNLIDSAQNAAGFFRIRVGACDADTAFTISMALALKLAEAGKNVDYALIWDRPHCEADYPGEVCGWIERIC
ncbi:hypothetical protein ADH76_18055 [Enterocloster clostridioformis]|uniref:hypothetical protein n=1 Tax=Enterocloster clostridioformis TaxID=1531 RepID=UPI00080C817E|nr:hypothetical protein [Enterocloster clostridioformis]ANU45653.1 hypothetical protein A4V08_07330 [Lachnoclostridium sp. YL32]NDO30490.1 hypothetical protein [Enterocloster clostridioformis]OXE67841.1 hypothetical protein ADH76_18055 [Enterocloster clostridioformis]QQQ99597.1 hypothetical protein I5Q83_27320 [Enterocloster clostridioformis]